jgi:hypothetical protein
MLLALLVIAGLAKHFEEYLGFVREMIFRLNSCLVPDAFLFGLVVSCVDGCTS